MRSASEHCHGHRTRGCRGEKGAARKAVPSVWFLRNDLLVADKRCFVPSRLRFGCGFVLAARLQKHFLARCSRPAVKYA